MYGFNFRIVCGTEKDAMSFLYFFKYFLCVFIQNGEKVDFTIFITNFKQRIRFEFFDIITTFSSSENVQLKRIDLV